MERIDELYIKDYRIYQDDKLFCFGTDAVLLYGFMPQNCGRVADLCSGNGAIALMLLAGQKACRVTAVELQEKGCALMKKSAQLNGCGEQIDIVCADICNIKDFLSAGAFDTVCVNPPYFKKGSGLLPAEQAVAIARHELTCDIDDVFSAASYLLKNEGEFCMVHRVSREAEICEKILKYDLKITEICHVFSTPTQAGELFLLRAKKTSAETLCKQSTFTVLNEDYSLSEAYKNLLK